MVHSHSPFTMNNYMKRLVSPKNSPTDENPPPESAPVGTASPIASRAKSSLQRINRLAPSNDKTTEVAPSSPSKNKIVVTTSHDDNGTKPVTSNRPSPRRIREYIRSGSNKGSNRGSGSTTEFPSTEQDPISDKTDGERDYQVEAPSKDSWMALTNDTDSESDGEEMFESPKQGPIPWDEAPSSIQIMMTGNVERELAEVRMDRDALRQRLSDLEDQLRNMKQSERRQTELEENALLEEEIDTLARLAREQEEKQRGNSMDGDGITISSDGAVKFPTGPSPGKLKEIASTLPTQEEKSQNMRVAELERALEKRKLREHTLWEEVRKLKEQAKVESKKFEESQRQVRWFQKELKAMFPQEGDVSSVGSSEDNMYGGNNSLKNHVDDNQDNAAHLETTVESKNIGDKHISGEPAEYSDNHVKLLHKQRLELEHRVQGLLDEIGTLRLEQKVYNHEKQQSDDQVLQLQKVLQEQQEQHRLELVLVERQLEEWKGRSDSFQTDLKEGRNLEEHLNARSQFERKERQDLSQRVEELELEKNELKDSLEKSRIDFEHEKGYLRRAMESLEVKLQEVTKESEPYHDNNDVPVLLDEDVPLPLDDDHSRRSRSSLSKPEISEEVLSRDDESSKLLLDRIQGLEAEREARIELERELREQLKNMTEQEKAAKNEAAAAEDHVRVLQTFLDASFSASPKKERELKQEYLSVRCEKHGEDEKTNKDQLHEESSQGAENPAIDIITDSPKSVKVVEMNPDSIKAEVDTFYDAPQRTSDLSTFLSQNNSPEIPARTGPLREMDDQSISSDAVHTVHTLHSKLDEEMEGLKKRREKRRSRAVSSAPWDNEKSEYYHLGQREKTKADDDFRIKMEEENSRLGTALETANYKKAQFEIELGDALQKVNDSGTRIETLTAEVVECRSSLETFERERSELTEKIDAARNETETLKGSMSKIGEEKKSFEATLSNLKEELNAKDKIILENGESHRIELEEMKKELEESRRASEEDQSSTNQISDLEAKILLIEKGSKANVEHLSRNLDGVLEERNALELKLHDACNQLDVCKKSEAKLREVAEEIIEKLQSAQDDIEKLSETKDFENSKLEKQVSERNQRIADLEEDLSSKAKRLEQACIQLSELENELFERDEEIEKLDAKRLQIQDNAAEQLVEMENLLGNDGYEIDRLREEKSKLQELVQRHEVQIEKQLGRLTEASMQLSELESELFAKDDEIEEMELRINAMQALEAQRAETSQDPESQKNGLKEQLLSSNQTIQNLTSQVESIKQERESEKTEAQRLLIEDEKKAKEILSRQNQVDRQLQNVSKLTEQNDKWQLQLEKACEEKQELLDSVSELNTEIGLIRKELRESNEKIKELNSINKQLREDLLCATEEDEKNRIRISQMEDQKEALSQKLESTLDNLAELLKQNEEVRELDERLSTGIIDQLQANFQSAQAVDEETESLITTLKAQGELERESLQKSELQRSELESENERLRNQIQELRKGIPKRAM